MQELGDGPAVTLSREMDVLYDPLESESGIRVSEAYTMITEYDLPSLPFLKQSQDVWKLNFFSVLLLFTD